MKIQVEIPELPKLPRRFEAPFIFGSFIFLSVFMVVVVWLSGYVLLAWILLVIGVVGLLGCSLMQSRESIEWYDRMNMLVFAILSLGGVVMVIIVSAGLTGFFKVLAGITVLFAIGFALWYQKRHKIGS